MPSGLRSKSGSKPPKGRSPASNAARGDAEPGNLLGRDGSISVTLLVVVAFASALLQIQHERGVAILFMAALGTFTVSLVDFAREVRIALSEFDHHA